MRSYWEIIGQALREARDEIEGSQREVAEWLNMQPLFKYCECEDGKEDPNEVLQKLMSALVERNEWARLCGQYKQERDEARDVLRIFADCRNWFHTTKEEGGPYTAWRGKREPDEIAGAALKEAAK